MDLHSPIRRLQLSINDSFSVGRSDEAFVQLSDSSISRKHATLTRTVSGIVVEDHDSRYGTFLNGKRIRTATLRIGDQVRFGMSTAYRLLSDALELDESPYGVSLEAWSLSVSGGDGRPLITDISFHLQPNQFVGILGPSGAGKSTLLNCVAGYRPNETGTLSFDGMFDVAECRNAYEQLLGHVPQNDSLPLKLTAQEILTLGAQLRGIYDSEAVDRVLEQVELQHHANKPSGNLSGGQRKRLSVGLELLKRPRLLLLDEPTAGLDPASEAHLMEQLRQIANRGTTVVCTTHLMDNLRLVDRLLVLGLRNQIGELAFDGPPENLFSHFNCRNHADIYELLASGSFPSLDHPQKLTPPTATATSLQGSRGAPLQPPNANQSSGWSMESLCRRAKGVLTSNSWNQFLSICRRQVLETIRDRGLMAAIVLQPLGLGLITCATQYRAGGITSLLFFSAVIAIWLGLNNSSRELVRERHLYVRDRLAGLRPEVYLLAKAIIFLAIGAIQAMALLVVMHLAGCIFLEQSAQLDLSRLSLFRSLLVLLLAYAGGLSLGLILSTIADTQEAAIALLPLLIMPQLMISVVATGLADEGYSRPRPFLPIAATVQTAASESNLGVLLDVCSLGCFSRPTTLAWEAKSMNGFGDWLWVGDFCHLLILVLACSSLAFWLFLKREQRWRWLVGLS